MRDYILTYLVKLVMVVAVLVGLASILAPIILVGFFGASPWWFMSYLTIVFVLPILIIACDY